ncbi:hypothetical protein [Streptacidiphilus anmyonensis]|uniref:hypothetical protein n=1 Tax=Streptacidiphilus anmyonensis TaxID=405782 RepID=UPI001364D505|nr:hypothetical protein [Streptacidiphilus anmyonensis]
MGLAGGFGRLRGSRFGLAATLVAVLAAVALVLVFALRSKPATPQAKASPSPTKAAPSPSPSPSPTLPNTFAYISLQPGDCFDSPAFSKSLTLLVKRACTGPHDAEVTRLTTLPDGLTDYPTIVHRSLELCEPLNAAAYRKQSVKELQYYQLYPSLAEYKGGRHTVTCALSGGSYQGARKLTAPLQR